MIEGVKKQQAAAYKGVNEVTTRKQNVAASIERAEAAVEMAKLNLSYCVVVAPCDGKLGIAAFFSSRAFFSFCSSIQRSALAIGSSI